MDWQPLALSALGLLYAGLLWEVRQLRKAKHEFRQTMQYHWICIFLLAKHLKFTLPKQDDDE